VGRSRRGTGAAERRGGASGRPYEAAAAGTATAAWRVLCRGLPGAQEEPVRFAALLCAELGLGEAAPARKRGRHEPKAGQPSPAASELQAALVEADAALRAAAAATHADAFEPALAAARTALGALGGAAAELRLEAAQMLSRLAAAAALFPDSQLAVEALLLRCAARAAGLPQPGDGAESDCAAMLGASRAARLRLARTLADRLHALPPGEDSARLLRFASCAGPAESPPAPPPKGDADSALVDDFFAVARCARAAAQRLRSTGDVGGANELVTRAAGSQPAPVALLRSLRRGGAAAGADPRALSLELIAAADAAAFDAVVEAWLRHQAQAALAPALAPPMGGLPEGEDLFFFDVGPGGDGGAMASLDAEPDGDEDRDNLDAWMTDNSRAFTGAPARLREEEEEEDEEEEP